VCSYGLAGFKLNVKLKIISIHNTRAQYSIILFLARVPVFNWFISPLLINAVLHIVILQATPISSHRFGMFIQLYPCHEKVIIMGSLLSPCQKTKILPLAEVVLCLVQDLLCASSHNIASFYYRLRFGTSKQDFFIILTRHSIVLANLTDRCLVDISVPKCVFLNPKRSSNIIMACVSVPAISFV
jgi:hypothetical protein